MTHHDPEQHLPEDHSPLPDLDSAGHRVATAEELAAVHGSEEFATLRRKFRSFAFPMTVAFFAWYVLYVLLSTYAVDFMATPAFGNLNVGLLLGLGQFLSTFLITWLYVRHANKSLDPIAAKLAGDLEGRA